MTTQAFIARSQDYYGEYSEEQQRVVASWLEKRTERERDIVYAEVLKHLSPKYKTPPGIYELEQAWKEATEHRRDELGPQPDHQQKQLPAESDEEPLTEEEAEYYFDKLKQTIASLAEAKSWS